MAYQEGQARRRETTGDVEGDRKPIISITRILSIWTKQGDFLFSFHLGTGTTVAAAHKFGRDHSGIEPALADSRPTRRLYKSL